MSLLRVSALTIDYPPRPLDEGKDSGDPAVDRVSFSVEKGEAVGIVGESGAGKSQTALAILGLLPANAQLSGSIRLAETEVIGASENALRKLRSNRVAMVFQDPATALNPYVTVGRQLERILLEHKIVPRKNVRARCIEMLARVGLHDPHKQYRQYPHQMSGGMRQRALIAAALIGEPDLIVADEPTTALDVTVQARILELLDDIRKQNDTALLLITHDLAVISQVCERVIVMADGAIIEQGLCRDVLSRPAHPHTAKLVSSALHADRPARHERIVSNEQKTLIDVASLSVRFPERRGGSRRDAVSRRHFVAVDGVDLNLQEGEAIAIVGESGSGKTTLARSIAGLLPGYEGRIRYSGRDLPWRTEKRPLETRRQMQMVFQDPVSSLNPVMRVESILSEPLRVHSATLSAADRRERVRDMLERVGLQPQLNRRYPHELSGGQAQRVAIARALMLEPKVLICDEALAALDGTVRSEILELLKKERVRAGLSLILITHDLGVVRSISDRVYVMHLGKVCEMAETETLFTNPQHAYTRELLAAIPRI